MWNKLTATAFKLPFLLVLVLLPWAMLSAQVMFRGKEVRTGIWNGRQVEYVHGEIAVKLRQGIQVADVLPLLQNYGANIRKDLNKLRWVQFEVPDTIDVLSLGAELSRNPLIQVAEPNIIGHACVVPDDDHFDKQWGLKNTGQVSGGTVDADIDAEELGTLLLEIVMF
ncbi:MAG: hypothetical protein ACETWG_07650 [Candidatus Neomarinimicrobiota bacterium]